MLVITRKVGERLVINNNIVVTIVSLDGNKVRLGIEAPRSVSVDRAEVFERKQGELAGYRNERELALV